MSESTKQKLFSRARNLVLAICYLTLLLGYFVVAISLCAAHHEKNQYTQNGWYMATVVLVYLVAFPLAWWGDRSTESCRDVIAEAWIIGGRPIARLRLLAWPAFMVDLSFKIAVAASVVIGALIFRQELTTTRFWNKLPHERLLQFVQHPVAFAWVGIFYCVYWRLVRLTVQHWQQTIRSCNDAHDNLSMVMVQVPPEGIALSVGETGLCLRLYLTPRQSRYLLGCQLSGAGRSFDVLVVNPVSIESSKKLAYRILAWDGGELAIGCQFCPNGEGRHKHWAFIKTTAHLSQHSPTSPPENVGSTQ